MRRIGRKALLRTGFADLSQAGLLVARKKGRVRGRAAAAGAVCGCCGAARPSNLPCL